MIYNTDGHNIAFSPSKVEIWFLYYMHMTGRGGIDKYATIWNRLFKRTRIYDVLVIQKEKHYNTWLYIFFMVIFCF